MENLVCTSCGTTGNGNYCNNCGKAFAVKRITVHSILHDVFHLFTHLDKGFLFTLKQLLVAPGTMQRTYVEGDRARHQKPFSMFFICATISALTRYWVYQGLIKWYGSGNAAEANFFHSYTVLLHGLLLPVYTLIAYLLFKNAKYNYAETGILTLYTISAFFLMASVVATLKFIWHEMDTAYIELPLFLLYNCITLLNFYNTSPKWLVIIKNIVIVGLIFLIANIFEDLFIKMIS